MHLLWIWLQGRSKLLQRFEFLYIIYFEYSCPFVLFISVLQYYFWPSLSFSRMMIPTFTNSNWQSAGLPWTVAKGQDTFTPISSVVRSFGDVICWLSFSLCFPPLKLDGVIYHFWDYLMVIFPFYFLQLPQSMVPDPHDIELWLKVIIFSCCRFDVGLHNCS